MTRCKISKSRRNAAEQRQTTAEKLIKPEKIATAKEVTTLRIYLAHYAEYAVCPGCKIPLEREWVNYCSNCGQRLSWEVYRNGNTEIEYCPPRSRNDFPAGSESLQEECVAAE